jgi:hypothetical protein
MLDISGLNKVELLKRLWEKQIVAGFFKFSGLPSPAFDKKEAESAVKKGYIDYFCGRAIKTDLSKNEVDTWLYNRDAGNNVFEEIVEVMRKIA